MHINNLGRVKGLGRELETLVSKFNSLKSQRDRNQLNVKILVTESYEHRNSYVGTRFVKINESLDGNRLVAKELDRLWGQIVTIRAELRELGVDLDGDG